jgi:multiple sugar transport system ATP-binding protein
VLAGEAQTVFIARVNPRTKARDGHTLELAVDTTRLHFFDPVTGGAIYAEASIPVIAA